MFPFVLIVILATDGNMTPEPVATFRNPQHCEAVAFITNTGFKKQGNHNKAFCVNALKHSEI